MAKKKPAGGKVTQETNATPVNSTVPNEPSSSNEQNKPDAESGSEASEITGIANGIANMSLTDKERGELDQQSKTREEIKAAREASKALKANKKKKNAAIPPNEAQAAEKPPVASNSEAPTAQVVVKQVTKANEKDISPEPKSVMKRDGPKGAREVQFDLNTTVVRTNSEETLVEEAPAFINTEPPLILNVHPAFITLASKCEREQITNIDDLCEQFLIAFKRFIVDWKEERLHNAEADPDSLAIDLDLAIRPQLAYLTEDGRWPMPYALGNIVRQAKREIKRLSEPCKHAHTKDDGSTAKELPGGCDKLEDFADWLDETRITFFEFATKTISEHLLKKMTNSTKILTFDWCRVVNGILLDLCSTNKNVLQIVVLDQQVDGRGIRHVESLVDFNVKLDYGDLRALSIAINQCSMVVIGCSAVLSNGCVAVPKGSLSIALAARANNVPFMVCSQTFKFVDKVQTYGRMALLGRENLELVPSHLVTAIVTDIRIVPPTSAPAILKAKALEFHD